MPGKNTRDVLGKPLIAWSIEAGLAAKTLDRLIVSTESETVAGVARAFGAEVLQRPAQLATDEATTISVLEHVAAQILDATTFVVLQPTSPVRGPGLIDECVRLFEDGDCTNLATGFWCKFQEFGSHNNMRRQDHKGFFYDDGNVYILSRELIQKGRWSGEKICRHVIDRHQNYEIDDEIDLAIVEALLRRYGAAT